MPDGGLSVIASIVALSPDVSWTDLRGELAYRRLAIGDATLRKVLYEYKDTAAAVDAVFLSFSKPIADGISAADHVSLALQKGISDAILVADGVSFSVAKTLADAASASDQVVIALSLSFSDSVTAIDAFGYDMGAEHSKAPADAVAASDQVSIGLSISKADTVSATDSVVVTVSLAPGPHSQLNGYPIGDWTLGD